MSDSVIPWTSAHQASPSLTISQSLLTLMSIESVMPSNHLILCHPLLLLPSIFPSIRVFSNESTLHIRWPKVLELQHQSFQWIFRVDVLEDLLVWSPYQIRSDQSLSRVRLLATPWIAARQASLSITNSQSTLRLTSITSVMPSSHLILCCPLLLLPPIPPSIRVFSNESALRMRWLKYWSFSFSIIPSKEIPGLISFRMDWLDLPIGTTYL